MSWLQDWVRTIIILVLFAGFLELLLPSGNMKPIVQVLMGLFVISLLLGPITSVLGYIRQQPEMPLPTVVVADTTTVLAQGDQLREERLEQVLAEYRSSVAKQIKALLKLKNETVEAEIMVNIRSDTNKADFGQLSSIQVSLQTSTAQGELTDTDTLAAFLADFYGLDRDKVTVTWAN